uniref:Uncharacterized protein n=1 Tax=Chlamydomonas euryale TaxID=1486919 RepID=A0A7R9VW83_9CHLO|mmetsp:Transcript_5036/g.15289  ORF Transcript_5036/g.15289 Transcript_5036/m.15289 type:complete len:220 (+) Transcript_5036:278-937(+)
MLPSRKHAEGSGAAYNNGVMVGNWWEDRFMPRDTKLTTTERVFARDLDAAPSPAADAFTSTQRAVESAVQAAVPPAPVRKPSMFASGDAAVEERLAAYSTPSAIAYMTGRVEPEVRNAPVERSFSTTARTAFAGEQPQRDGSERYFPQAERLRRDTWGAPSEPEKFGAKGGRGEITRNPREAGNPYGVSVFVDEYAQWGTKLAGMPLNESVGRATTKYF